MNDMEKAGELEKMHQKVLDLTEEIVRNYEEINLLYELTETLNSSLDVDMITELVLEISMDFVAVHSGSIMLLDKKMEYLYVQKSKGRSIKKDFRLKIGQGIAGRIMETQKGVILNNIAERPDYINDCQTTKSLIYIPIKTRNRIFGILKLSDKRNGDIFTSNDLKFASTIANQAGLAMENAMLHELKLEEKIDEQETLFTEDLEKLSDKFDFDDEMIQGFVDDCRDLIKEMDRQILSLGNEADDKNVINGLFRNMHTIKGTAKFFQYQQLIEIAHSMEDVFSLLRDKKVSLVDSVIDLLLEGVESIRELLGEIAETKKDNGRDFSSLLSGLKGLKDNSIPAPRVEGSVKRDKVPKFDFGLEKKEKKHSDQIVRVPIRKLNRFTDLIQRMNNMSAACLSGIKQKLSSGIDEEEQRKEAEELNLLLPQLDQMYCDTQLQLMNLRNVPVKDLFARLPKMVRDLAAELKKKVNLEISTDESEIDKALIEEFSGPMVHIIRNAVDHGIESIEDRKKAGKPEAGTIELGARQEGSDVVITIKDDGGGLNAAGIKAQAVAKGIITKDEAASMSDPEAINLIFTPGFSTSKNISDISGRGVGMNVVRESADKLKGQIYIDTEVGAGTTFKIQVPSTLAISKALIVEIDGQTYAISIATVKAVTNVGKNDLHEIIGKEFIRYRDSVLPLVRLKNILSGSPRPSDSLPQYPVVIASIRGKSMGLVVDKVNGKREILVKPLNHFLKNSRYVSGATIVGDSVILIMDVNAIIGSGSADIEEKRIANENQNVSLPLNGDHYDFCIFKLNGERYGIELRLIQEIIRYDREPIRIPGELEWIKGVINLRNNIVPIVDLKKRLGLWKMEDNRIANESENSAAGNGPSMVLVARINNEAVGFCVDEVIGLHRVSKAQIKISNDREMLNGGHWGELALVDNDIVKLLNVEKISAVQIS